MVYCLGWIMRQYILPILYKKFSTNRKIFFNYKKRLINFSKTF